MDDAAENVKAFVDLDGHAWRELVDLNRRIQEHRGPWGEWRGGSLEYDRLVTALLDFWNEKDLVVVFDWPGWQEGRDWYRSTDDRKYADLDASTALKLLTAVMRNDRFSEGALVRAFDSGDVPRILNRLVEIRDSGNVP